MDGGLADAEAGGGGPYGGLVLDDVQRQLLGALFHVPLHKTTLPTVVLVTVIYMREETEI